jgi:hypothetical protein
MEKINRRVCMNESEYVNAPPDSSNERPAKGDLDSNSFSRRSFLQSALAAAGLLLIQELKAFPESAVLATMPPAVTVDLVHDTLNGLSAFVVPGPDAYSVAQGVSTPEPGAIAALVTEIFIPVLDGSVPFVPNFSAVVAGILNQLALAVNPAPVGPFNSPFANLSFNEKVVVFQIMDATDSLKPLAGVLPAFAAYICYSEASVLDRATHTITGQPVGWSLSNYEGATDGFDEFLGYFENRRRAD